VIDVHAHVVLEDTLGAAGTFGPLLETAPDGGDRFVVGQFVLEGVPYRSSPFMDLDLRLEAMDRIGIERQVLSPNPLTLFHHVPVDVAAPFCRRHNDALARLVACAPDRLLGLAQLPVQDVAASVVELRRCVGELGLIGTFVGTDPGVPLDDERLDVLYEAHVEADVPLFLHPVPRSVVPGTSPGRLGRWDLELALGFATDEAVAVAELVFGGVLDRHPCLDVCIAHGGGVAAFVAERLAEVARRRPAIAQELREEGVVQTLLERVWFDTHVPGPRALDFVRATFGDDRLVLGTNFAGWDAPAQLELGPLGTVLEGNARRLLRLR
jgi:aminocarboxymuconate-semialdehyde decarboxylase